MNDKHRLSRAIEDDLRRNPSALLRDAKFSRIDPQTLHVRITRDDGPHTYIVKVSEQKNAP